MANLSQPCYPAKPLGKGAVLNTAETDNYPSLQHHCTICTATLQMGDREGRPYIMWQLRHWGAADCRGDLHGKRKIIFYISPHDDAV